METISPSLSLQVSCSTGKRSRSDARAARDTATHVCVCAGEKQCLQWCDFHSMTGVAIGRRRVEDIPWAGHGRHGARTDGVRRVRSSGRRPTSAPSRTWEATSELEGRKEGQ